MNRLLPFGAPKIFTTLADVVLVQYSITKSLHYLDNFVLVTGVLSEADLAIQGLGVPQELDGPSTCLSFLGLEIDSTTLQLPEVKLCHLTMSCRV